eukprot:9495360-Pyramimonas_sp.AAC.1
MLLGVWAKDSRGPGEEDWPGTSDGRGARATDWVQWTTRLLPPSLALARAAKASVEEGVRRASARASMQPLVASR